MCNVTGPPGVGGMLRIMCSVSGAHVARAHPARIPRAHVAHMLRTHSGGVGAEVVVQPTLTQVGVALTLHRSCYSGTPPGAGRHHMCSVSGAHELHMLRNNPTPQIRGPRLAHN